MEVAFDATKVLFASAIGILLAPSIGLHRHPRACVWVSSAGAALAVAVVALQVAVPLAQGQVAIPLARGLLLVWPGNYFLAMANSLNPGLQYPFSSSYWWAYGLGTLTPLIGAGGVCALGAGYFAVRGGARVGVVPFVIGACAVLVYALGTAITAAWTWYGVPV